MQCVTHVLNYAACDNERYMHLYMYMHMMYDLGYLVLPVE